MSKAHRRLIRDAGKAFRCVRPGTIYRIPEGYRLSDVTINGTPIDLANVRVEHRGKRTYLMVGASP
jgi:hypothetical protein